MKFQKRYNAEFTLKGIGHEETIRADDLKDAYKRIRNTYRNAEHIKIKEL